MEIAANDGLGFIKLCDPDPLDFTITTCPHVGTHEIDEVGAE